MVSVLDELEAAALSLPIAERAHLAERLIASLDEDGEIEEAWAEEVRRRLELYRSGELEAISAESVVKEARERLRK